VARPSVRVELLSLTAGEGVTITIDKFDEVMPLARKAMSQALDAIARAVQQRAKNNIVTQGAVDTGALLNSVYVQSPLTDEREQAISAASSASKQPGRKSKKPHDQEFTPADVIHEPKGPMAAKVAVAAFYGLYIEAGTVHSGERPFLNPAAESVKSEANDLAAAIVAKALEGLQ
jgi:hypothetical protein